MNRYLSVIFFFLFVLYALPFGENRRGAAFAQEGPIKEYHTNGKVKSEINFYNGIREGEAKFYYENGNLKEELFYSNGRIEGLVRYYNEAGKLIEMANLENGKREGPTSIFDSTGAYITDIYYQAGKKVVEHHPYYEQIPAASEVIAAETIAEPAVEQKELVKPAKSVRKNQDEMLPPEIDEESDEIDPAYYLTVEVMPEPVGGSDQIQRKVLYPKEARENGIQGTVKILTFIDEHGVVKQADVVEGIGYGCDESARIAVYYTKFKPGLQRGKPVKVQMTIPVEFKLNP
ncbi:MAG: TonB family protein [Ignavibacteriaceae bacterium]